MPPGSVAALAHLISCAPRLCCCPLLTLSLVTQALLLLCAHLISCAPRFCCCPCSHNLLCPQVLLLPLLCYLVGPASAQYYSVRFGTSVFSNRQQMALNYIVSNDFSQNKLGTYCNDLTFCAISLIVSVNK